MLRESIGKLLRKLNEKPPAPSQGTAATAKGSIKVAIKVYRAAEGRWYDLGETETPL